MKFKSFLLLIALIGFVACKEPIARKPITTKGDTFFKESVELNKKLNAEEELMIKAWLEKDTLTIYYPTNKGFWVHYIEKDTLKLPAVKKGDLVNFSYEVTDIDNQIIYPLQDKKYKVDEEILIPGLQDGIKLLKPNEEVIFLFPSYKAYGYQGDKKEIHGRQTLKYRIKINSIQNTK